MIRILIFITALIVSFASIAEPNIGHFVTYDGLKIRTAKLTTNKSQAKGTIILLQGMGSYIEGDTEFMQMLVNQGYDVLTFDWRGQGASQRMTKQSTLLHIVDFNAYLKDLETFVSNLKNIQGPLILMGNSMGGHLALRYAHDYPKRIDAVVTLAPMVEIKTDPYPSSIAKGLANFFVAIGWGEKFVFGYDSFSFEKCVNNYNPNKYGDLQRYLNDCKRFKEKPYLAVGGPSFNWLKEAFKSCKTLQSPGYAQEIQIPMLMVAVPNDHLVEPKAQRQICASVPRCTFHLYEQGHHNLLRETNEVMKKFFVDLENFHNNYLMPDKDRTTKFYYAFSGDPIS